MSAHGRPFLDFFIPLALCEIQARITILAPPKAPIQGELLGVIGTVVWDLILATGSITAKPIIIAYLWPINFMKYGRIDDAGAVLKDSRMKNEPRTALV